MSLEEQYSLVLLMMDALSKNGSWCGETHIQKNLFLLENLEEVHTNFAFVLYKHGPYSFELHDAIGDMSSLGFIQSKSTPPYGPKLLVTEKGSALWESHKKALPVTQVNKVAREFGSNTVQDLEKKATALLLLKKNSAENLDDIACELHTLKPHIPFQQAREAVQFMYEKQADN